MSPSDKNLGYGSVLVPGLLGLLLGLLLEVLGEADVGADGVLVPGLSGEVAAGVALVAVGVLLTTSSWMGVQQ